MCRYLGHFGIVKLLVEHECYPNICYNDDESPLFKAEEVEHNCDSNICDGWNNSPLFIAFEYGHSSLVRVLFEHNCDHDICNDFKISLLYIASNNDHTKSVKVMLEHNCDPSSQYSGISPLFEASKNGHFHIVELLLDHKGNPNICIKYRSSPSLLFIATREGRTDIVRLLLENECDPNILQIKLNQTTEESKEEMNYLRIISLLYKVAPSAVRIKFDKEFHPTNGLETALKQDKFRVLDPLKRKRIINQKQWDLMFPPKPGTVSSTKFDLTLMICLIRHLTPIQIGDILPLPYDVSHGAG
ncbi:unnamed protein product [Mytilus coruscus]|uniref:DZIP3-like HEPN domain-containing protein n=1 Tax=Mytilus coruscus TaxID=42192 RepID=A0A6J8D303_MYTCO|nr:unnamed protein product [Mytilus coruscus]